MASNESSSRSELTAELCALAAEVLGLASIAPTATFFDDLGADSLTMAKFCAAVRRRPGLPRISMKDVYRRPSVEAIVAGLTAAAPATTSVPVPRVGGPTAMDTVARVLFAVEPPVPAPADGFVAILGAYCRLLAEVLEIDGVPAGAHVFEDLGADSMAMAKFCARVRKHPDLPSASMKDVYRHPTLAELAAALAPAAVGAPAPAVATPVESGTGLPTVIDSYRQLLAEVLETDDVTVTADVFADLGADSLTMATFCARVRKRPDLPRVTMKDIYAHPSLKQLAAALAPMGEPAIAEPPEAAAGWVEHVLATDNVLAVAPAPSKPAPPAAPPRIGSPELRPVGRVGYWLCGTVQLIVLLLLPLLITVASVAGYRWLSPANGPVENYLRASAFAAAAVVACFLLPVLLKWTLIGRWKAQRIRVWSGAYLRFWLVKSVVQKNPLMPLMIGSPLYCVYLRALGARIGRGTTIFTNQVPVCTDLFSVGEDVVIRRDTVMPGYHAEAGVIHTGSITLGDRVVVGAKAVVDIDTALGDDAQLGHASSLHPGQRIPAGEKWYGSPAEPGSVDFSSVEPDGCRSCSRRRRTVFGVSQLLWTILFTIPVGLAVLDGFWTLALRLSGGVPGTASLTSGRFYATAALASAALFFGALLLALPVLNLTARALSLLVRPGTVYRLHGVRHSALRTITRITNMKFYSALVADSSYVVHYLRLLGYRVTPILQTGTNFGTVAHDTPFAARVGTGTVVADGLTILNVDYSASTFRVAPVSICAHSFLGNGIAYPPRAKVGDDCLIGTMTMVPIDGPVRTGVGLLGSPPFEIPRTVARDHGLAIEDPAEVSRRLWAKNRHNTVTVFMSLFVRWISVFAMFVLAEVGGEAGPTNALGVALAEAGYAVFLFAFYFTVERAFTRYASLCPAGVSIYDKAFWRHERYWKVPSRGYIQFLAGTPFKPVMWRMLGAKVGRRVFDDGASFPEKSFVTVGDFVTLNAGSGVQTHSQEDGAFKSARSVVESGATLGVASFAHYGVTIGAGAVLAADSFLMKGEQVPAGEYWAGNPAYPAEPFETSDAGVVPVAPLPVVRSGRIAPAGVRGGWLLGYSFVLAVAAVFLLAEPGWDLAMRGVGVGSIVVAAALDARVLARRRRADHHPDGAVLVAEPADTSS